MALDHLQTPEEKRRHQELRVQHLESAQQELEAARTSGHRVFVPAGGLALGNGVAGKVFFKVDDTNALRSKISKELSKLKRQGGQ